MAHGYLDKLQNGLAKIYSTGIETHGLNPSTEAVMAEEKHTAFIKARNEIKEYCQKFVLRELD
jgi:arsenate reductase